MTAWLFCKRAGVVKEDGRAATFTATPEASSYIA